MRIVSAQRLSKLSATLDRLRESIARKLESAAEYSHDSLSYDEAQKQALLQAMPDFVFRIRYDGVVSLVSAGSLKFVPMDVLTPGRIPDSPIAESGNQPHIARSPEDIARLLINELSRQRRVLVDRAIRTGRVQTVEFQIQHNEQIAYCQVRSVACGKREALAIVRDITALKVTEAEAANTRAKVETMRETAQMEAARHAEERQLLKEDLREMEMLLVAVKVKLEAKINETNEKTAELDRLKEALQREIALHTEEARLLRTSLDRTERLLEETIAAVSMVAQKRDPYTAGHQQRVSELACAIGREMSLDNDQIRVIRIAALLHDLGKVFIPTEILVKPGRLNPTELSMVKTHPEADYEILKTIDFPGLANIVRQHHERIDGSGYPLGLKGEDILIEAKILAVADVVEAMISRRPHRPEQNLEEVLEEIRRGSGTLYDPEVVDACTKLFGEGRFSFRQDEGLR